MAYNKSKIMKGLKKFGRFALIILNMSLNILMLKGNDSNNYAYYQAMQVDEDIEQSMVRTACTAPVGVACA